MKLCFLSKQKLRIANGFFFFFYTIVYAGLLTIAPVCGSCEVLNPLSPPSSS